VPDRDNKRPASKASSRSATTEMNARMKEKTEKFDEARREQTKKKDGDMKQQQEAFSRAREAVSRKRQKDAVLAKLEMQSKKSAALKTQREVEALKQKK
jgi:hypothetical protein